MSDHDSGPAGHPGPRTGPLAGLRVVDLTADLGRFASKLLAEHGAEVCRPHLSGSRGVPMAAAATGNGPGPAHGPGVLDWWFDGAKVPVELDLTTGPGRDGYRRLAAGADLVLDGLPVGYLADAGIDHADLVADNPRLVQVSLSPFGRTGPRSHWQGSDLVAGAMGGVLSLTGTPEGPLNSWGWQNYNFGGFVAAICGLAAVRAARRDGVGQLVDVSLHEVVTGSIENLMMQYFYHDHLDYPRIAPRQGSLHWLGAYQVVPARSGYLMVTPTPQAESLVDWMVASGVEGAERYASMPLEDLLADMAGLMEVIRSFAATGDAGRLFAEAQARHIAFGEVQTVAQVLANPQFAHRAFFATIATGDGMDTGAGSGGGAGRAVTLPARLVRFDGTPTAPPSAPTWDPVPADAVAERWSRDRTGEPPGRAAGDRTGEPDGGVDGDRTGDPPGGVDGGGVLARPLEGVVVLDLSWVLAGPFATRILGDLGADVIKVQTEERATSVNRPDFPYYPVWNRSKRSVTLDLKHPDAVGLVRRLVERADVLVENYSAGVLDRLGLGWDTVHGWNDRLVYISMSGCGHDGPWADVISYAPTVHALCGLTHLTNHADRGDLGCGFSLNDHAAGFAAAFSVLAALRARETTGVGQHLDMAQLEVGAHLLGPAIVDLSANGREATPAGNVDGLTDAVPNEVYRCGDGRFLAVTALDDAMWSRLAAVVGCPDGELGSVGLRRIHRHEINRALQHWCDGIDAGAAMDRLQGAGVAAGVVQDAADLAEADPQLAARRFWLDVDHDVFGARRHDRFPALWDRSALEPYRPPPNYLGEANFDVWGDLVGLDPAEVAEGMGSGLFT